jgi:hypothetical protein
MTKRIEKRSNFVRWFACIANHHNKAINDLLDVRVRSDEQAADIRAKIAEHRKLANDAVDEECRYAL